MVAAAPILGYINWIKAIEIVLQRHNVKLFLNKLQKYVFVRDMEASTVLAASLAVKAVLFGLHSLQRERRASKPQGNTSNGATQGGSS